MKKIIVQVKTPKEKQTVEIEENASIKAVSIQINKKKLLGVFFFYIIILMN